MPNHQPDNPPFPTRGLNRLIRRLLDREWPAPLIASLLSNTAQQMMVDRIKAIETRRINQQ